MEKGLTLLPSVLPPKLKSEAGSSSNEAFVEKQSKEGSEHGALLAQILQLDTTGLLSSVRLSLTSIGLTNYALNGCIYVSI